MKPAHGKHWQLLALLVLLSAVPHPALSDVLILSPENEYGQSLAQRIKTRIQNSTAHDAKIVSEIPRDANPTLTITLGDKTLAENSSQIPSPLIAAFTSPQQYHRSAPSHSIPRTPVFLQIPAEELLNYIHTTFGSVRLGYIYNDDDPYLLELIKIAPEYGIQIISEPQLNNNIFKSYRRFFKHQSIDLMLITQDSSVYKPKNLRHIMEVLYRQRVPALSISQSHINAGAVAAIYLSEEDLINQTVLLAKEFLSGGTLSHQTVDRPKISINRQMMKRYQPLMANDQSGEKP